MAQRLMRVALPATAIVGTIAFAAPVYAEDSSRPATTLVRPGRDTAGNKVCFNLMVSLLKIAYGSSCLYTLPRNPP